MVKRMPRCGHALKTADGGEAAAVADGGDHKLVEHGSVREPIDALGKVFAKPRRDIIAPSNDDVGAERRDQLFVFSRTRRQSP